jgi:hypothetical protein
MSKSKTPRFQQSSKKKNPEIHSTLDYRKRATKLQVWFAMRLLVSMGMKCPDDESNLRHLRRNQISALINGLKKKRERQPQGNKPSPLPNRSRDNAQVCSGPTQGETPKDVAGLTLQP